MKQKEKIETPPALLKWIRWCFSPRPRGMEGELSAFTLIELLIVVAIMAVIGISSISGFSHMIESQDAETTTRIISNAIDSFDRDILRNKSVSYDIVLESGSIGFTTNLDWYKKKPSLQYSFDFTTGSGSVQSTETDTGMAELHFASSDTSWNDCTLSMSGWIQIFSFPLGVQKRWEKILSNLNGESLNFFVIQYYNLTNIDNIPENEVHLTSITGGDNRQYSSLLIRNVLGHKVLLGSGATLDSLEKATLTFEKNGKEIQMTVSR